MVKSFDPAQVACIVGGKIIKGFADGTAITVERNEQAFNLKIGIDGEGARAKSNNRAGKVTFSLQQTSESNDDLSAFAAADELNSTGAVPMLIKDNSGRTVVSALTAWVQKYPNVEYGSEILTRAWVLETDALEIFLGGN